MLTVKSQILPLSQISFKDFSFVTVMNINIQYYKFTSETYAIHSIPSLMRYLLYHRINNTEAF